MKGKTMNRRPIIFFMSGILALLLAGAVYAGGWAIVTLSEFPDYAVAGKPLNLTFAVRQHGVTLLSDLQPKITAMDGNGNAINGKVAAGSAKGDYAAALTLPQPGDWKITIDSGFNGNIITLPGLKVIAADSPAPTPFAPGTRGVRLFTAKGCVGCHRHIEVNPERKTDAKFDLTGRRFPNDYLKKFLADPSIKPAEMPNLKLKDDEIESLAAFINKAVKKQVER
jgi:mono/diheme cytochrome c family protein